MSGIALTTPISRGSDSGVDVQFIGINYLDGKVTVRLLFQQTGQTKDFTFEGAALNTMRSAVSQFGGLRVSMLQYLQTLDATLGGGVT